MELSATAKKMLLVICVSSLVFIAAGAAFYRSPEALPFALGVMLMGGVNAARVFMLERAVQRAAGMEAQSAANYIRLQYFLRFVITGLALVAAVFVPFINLWGAAAGVLTWSIAALPIKPSAVKS